MECRTIGEGARIKRIRSVRLEEMADVRRREVVAEAPLSGTDRRLVVTREYRRALDHPSEIVSPLQSEFAWSVGVYEQQRREPSARCEIRSWTGEFDGVFPAPDGSVAAVRWNDQTEAGLVLVEVASDLRQLDAAWDTRATNWLEGPVWWPDSSSLVVVENPEGAGAWWAEREGEYADDEDVSPGGTFTPGSLVVLDRDLHELSRARIDVDLPRGWFPADDDDRGLAAPIIESSGKVVVRVPAEGERYLDIGAA
jgi:hypothetical protein